MKQAPLLGSKEQSYTAIFNLMDGMGKYPETLKSSKV